MKSVFDILEKIDEVNFRWLEATQDLQSAKSRIEEREAQSPSEYVVFDRRTQQISGVGTVSVFRWKNGTMQLQVRLSN